MGILEWVLIGGVVIVVGFMALRQYQNYCEEHACEPLCPAEDCGSGGIP